MSESKEIDDKCYEYLYVSDERTSLFYMLPKIHNKPKNPPGRPIDWATVALLKESPNL